MNYLWKRTASLFLSVVLVLGMLPASAVGGAESVLSLSVIRPSKDGLYRVGESVEVRVSAPDNVALFYTLDGTVPTEDSARVEDNKISVTAEKAGTIEVQVLAVVPVENSISAENPELVPEKGEEASEAGDVDEADEAEEAGEVEDASEAEGAGEAEDTGETEGAGAAEDTGETEGAGAAEDTGEAEGAGEAEDTSEAIDSTSGSSETQSAARSETSVVYSQGPQAVTCYTASLVLEFVEAEAIMPLSLDGYATQQTEEHAFSLTVNETTYYFSDLQSAFEAGNDSDLAGEMTLKVLKSNDVDSLYSCGASPVSSFTAATALKIDLNGHTLALGTSDGPLGTLILAASESVSIYDSTSSDGSRNGKLLLYNTLIGSSKIAEIKNVSIIGYSENYLEKSHFIYVFNSAQLSIENASIEMNSPESVSTPVGDVLYCGGPISITISESSIVNEHGKCLWLSGMTSKTPVTLNVTNCSMKANDANGPIFYLYGGAPQTLSVSGGTYQGKTIMECATSASKGNLTISDGVFIGTLGTGKVANTITIGGGIFSEDPLAETEGVTKPTISTENDVTKTQIEEGNYKGYYQFCKETTMPASVTKVGTPNAAEVQYKNTAYIGEDYTCEITLLPEFYISKILFNAAEQSVEAGRDGYGLTYSEDRLTAVYKVKVPECESLSLEFTISENPSLTQTAATIGNVPYKSLSAALAALKAGDTLKLEANVTYPTAIILSEKDFTLDLNGKTLTVEYDSPLGFGIRIVGGSLAIEDSSTEKSGKVSFASKSSGIQLEPGTNGGANFTLKNGTIGDINLSDPAQAYIIGTNTFVDAQGSNITIQGGTVYGRVVAGSGSNLTISGGEIHSAGVSGTVASFFSNGTCKIDGTALICSDNEVITGEGALNLVPGASGTVIISGGQIRATNTCAAIHIPNGTDTGTITINGTAEIVSKNGAALEAGVHVTGSENHLVIQIGGNAKLKGGTYAVEVTERGYYRNLPSIQVSGGYFACGEGFLPISDTYCVTYSDGYVLNTKCETADVYDGYYTLAQKADLGGIYQTTLNGTAATFKYSYQDFDGYSDGSGQGLKSLLEDQAAPIYTSGNGSGKYPADAWDAFTEAYDLAKRLYDNNRSANQMEIDYRMQKLSAAIMALDSASDLDPENLPDGTYHIQAALWKYNLSGLSMANGALQPDATLVKNGNKWTLQLQFQPLFQYNIWGHLEDFYIYNGSNLNDGAINQSKDTTTGSDMSVKTEAKYNSWYKGDNVSNTQIFAPPGTIGGKGTEYPLPGSVDVVLPYHGTSSDLSYYWIGMNVDAMGGYATAILRLSWSTLEKVDTRTLSISESDVTLLKNQTAEVTANVAGETGWTFSWKSSDETIATVAGSGNTATIQAKEKSGVCKVTVTASKAGQESLTNEISVTVKEGSQPIQVETITNGKTAEITIRGDAVLDDNKNVTISSSKVTIAAKTGGSGTAGAKITILADTLNAIQAEGKALGIETDIGALTLDADLVADAARSGEALVLTISGITPPSVDGVEARKLTSAYELAMFYGSRRITSLAGGLTITVPWSENVGYAYYLEGSELTERTKMIVSGGLGNWVTNHLSTWVLSSDANLISVGIKNGTYSVPIEIKQAGAPNRDSMANDATGDMVVAKVTDKEVIYTMFLKARVGSEGVSSGESLRGHLLKMWYYAPDDTGLSNPIRAAVVRTYKDIDMNGNVDTFPREIEVKQDGTPNEEYYIQVSVDAMGGDSALQDALVKLDWDRALDDGGKAAREGFEDDLAMEQTIKSGDKVSRSDLKKWIDNEFTLLVEGKDDDLSMHFDTEALEDIYNQTDSDVKFVIEQASKSKLTEEQKEVIGDRPVYELAITSGKKTITKIEDGEVEITLPYALQKDEKKDGLAVWFVDEDGSIEKIRFSYSEKSKKITFFTERFGICVIAYDEEQIWENPFTDIREEDWFFEAVKYVAQNGLFCGTAETTFSPTNPMTRGMLVTVLHRLAGKPEVTNPNSFSDVLEDSYCAEAVAWAMQNKIVSGYGDGLFRPDNNVTRQQMVAILYNYAKHKDYDVSLVKGLDDFTDSHLIDSYAIRAMQWATANEIVYGTTSTTLYPHGESTRAQVAVVLMQFNEKIVIPQEKAKEEAARETEETAKKS